MPYTYICRTPHTYTHVIYVCCCEAPVHLSLFGSFLFSEMGFLFVSLAVLGLASTRLASNSDQPVFASRVLELKAYAITTPFPMLFFLCWVQINAFIPRRRKSDPNGGMNGKQNKLNHSGQCRKAGPKVSRNSFKTLGQKNK